ncbi:hypothetical protein CHL76_14625 [Marinococcus halophilus]|uniref:DUF2089 domain-containing protein n=1 Tax=Marinococcus halophilus TaxID=1371 RepID=A0A510Y9C5_MARHA|nr:DUF2089 family protein [Marinococcus halophilus]OZT79051.1 hypothetical protein CHL76_14625 [Marinococcus halophilus]GEK59965.1 hypothetical protein MHA01_28700 [Marinococcus halophilus]
MDEENIPAWIRALDEESLEFIRQFVTSSGSLKEVARLYEVSYPTVRNKLNIIIEKINAHHLQEEQEFITMIRNLVIDDKISLDIAKKIIDQYKKDQQKE